MARSGSRRGTTTPRSPSPSTWTRASTRRPRSLRPAARARPSFQGSASRTRIACSSMGATWAWPSRWWTTSWTSHRLLSSWASLRCAAAPHRMMLLHMSWMVMHIPAGRGKIQCAAAPCVTPMLYTIVDGATGPSHGGCWSQLCWLGQPGCAGGMAACACPSSKFSTALSPDMMPCAASMVHSLATCPCAWSGAKGALLPFWLAMPAGPGTGLCLCRPSSIPDPL